MLYPKKEAGGAKPKTTQSRRFLNPGQKEELKRVVAERLAKKYGIKYQELIKDEVNNFINHTQNITANALKDLENNIHQATKVKNTKTNGQNQYDDDAQSVKSGISKMSGASNFDDVDYFTKKTLTKQETEEQEKYKDKKLQTMNVQPQKNDLDFLDEENEWAAIYKYNKYMYDKEQDAIKEKERLQKIMNKKALDAQVKEKQEKKFKERKLDEQYASNMQIQMDRFDHKEKLKEEELQKLKVVEKDARQRQIKENKYKRRHEEKQQKALDSYLMQKVREELEQEQKYQQFKKEHQAQVTAKLLQENEERKAKLEEEERNEKEENIRLMNAYAKLISEQEEEREKNLKERDRKMKDFQAKALEQVSNDFEDKLGKMEARREKYERRYEQKLQDEEDRAKQKIIDNKKDMKQFLFQQMEEKAKRKVFEKKEYNSQADIWKQDNMKYSDYENARENKRRDIMSNYALTLKQQMQENKEVKQQSQQKMTENETFINRYLLDELDRIKQQQEPSSVQ